MEMNITRKYLDWGKFKITLVLYIFNSPASVHAEFPRSQDKRVGIALFLEILTNCVQVSLGASHLLHKVVNAGSKFKAWFS